MVYMVYKKIDDVVIASFDSGTSFYVYHDNEIYQAEHFDEAVQMAETIAFNTMQKTGANEMNIRVENWDGLSYKVGTVTNVSVSDMVALLGPANHGDDLDKVSHSWRFYVDDQPVNIWDWKGSCFEDRWSFYGHPATIAKLFGENNVQV